MKSDPVRLGVVMDPIGEIKPYKDSTLAMLLEAQSRGWALSYMELPDLYVLDDNPRARATQLEVRDDNESWFTLGECSDISLRDLDVILMRKDPPFDMEYIYTTYILQLAEDGSALVVNNPRSLREVNEKAYTAWFPQCSPPTVITRSQSDLGRFLTEHQKVVVKPLDGMGGRSIFIVERNDANVNVIFETITRNETAFVTAQKFIPEISTSGDKRVLLVDGKPIPYSLARMPTGGDSRGNLAVGARSEGRPLDDSDYRIAAEVGPALKELGLLFVGLDVIGDYLTEINVTSPTCIRELDAAFDLNISASLFDAIERRLGPKVTRRAEARRRAP